MKRTRILPPYLRALNTALLTGLAACATSVPAANLSLPSTPVAECTLPAPTDSSYVGVEGTIETAYRAQRVPREVLYTLVHQFAKQVVWTPHSIQGLIGAPELRNPVILATGSARQHTASTSMPLTSLIDGMFALEVRGDGTVIRTETVESTRDESLDAAITSGIASLDSMQAFTPLVHALRVAPGKSVRLVLLINTVSGPGPGDKPASMDPALTSHVEWRIATVWQPTYSDAHFASPNYVASVRAPLGAAHQMLFGDVVIDQNGHAVPSTLHTFDGSPEFVEAVRRSLPNWTFHPARIEGCQVMSRMPLSVRM